MSLEIHISKITLCNYVNVNRLTALPKRHRLAEWIQKQTESWKRITKHATGTSLGRGRKIDHN